MPSRQTALRTRIRPNTANEPDGLAYPSTNGAALWRRGRPARHDVSRWSLPRIGFDGRQGAVMRDALLAGDPA